MYILYTHILSLTHMITQQTWRPLAIHKMTTKFERILWLDPGTTVECALDDIKAVLDQQGVFALANARLSVQRDIGSTVKEVLEYNPNAAAGADADPTGADSQMLPVCAPGAMGFDVRAAESAKARALVEEWASM